LDTGSFHDVCFVVEEERVLAHRSHLYATCEYFRSMFGAGFREGDGGEIHIEGPSRPSSGTFTRTTWRWMMTRCSLI
jgi:hypothetical protein